MRRCDAQGMTLVPFDGFRAFPTLHCVTGSMRHIYQFRGQEVGEELLLGLGAGVGFIYWQQKGQPPFLGGRANMSKPDKDGFEVIAGRRTGVEIAYRTTSSAKKARSELLADLTSGIPVMVQVEMGYLPYFNFDGEYHFGGHVVAIVGYDEETGTVLISDRDEEVHPVPMETLETARASKFHPFPPQHGHWTFDFSGQRPPQSSEVQTAIQAAADAMLNPPIKNFGIAGIRKASALVPEWQTTLDPDQLRLACLNGFIMIDATGGTGGFLTSK